MTAAAPVTLLCCGPLCDVRCRIRAHSVDMPGPSGSADLAPGWDLPWPRFLQPTFQIRNIYGSIMTRSIQNRNKMDGGAGVEPATFTPRCDALPLSYPSKQPNYRLHLPILHINHNFHYGLYGDLCMTGRDSNPRPSREGRSTTELPAEQIYAHFPHLWIH